MSGLLDWLQVPVQIVKVLVYKDGKLQQASEGASPHRVAAEASERTLSSVKADRYKAEPPVKPSPDKPGEGDDKKPADDAGDKPADDKPADKDGEEKPVDGQAGGDDK